MPEKKQQAVPADWRPRRSGQRVKFNADLPPQVADRHQQGLPAVHRTQDGMLLGTYVQASRDALGNELPERVMLLDVAGNNVEMFVRGQVANVYFLPEDVQESWQPLLDRADMPPEEKYNRDWVPLP